MSKKMAKSEKSVYEPLSFNIVYFENDVKTNDIISASGVGTKLTFTDNDGEWF